MSTPAWWEDGLIGLGGIGLWLTRPPLWAQGVLKALGDRLARFISKGRFPVASDPTPQPEAPAAPAPADLLPDIQKIIQLGADVFQQNTAAVTKDIEDPAIAALAAEALVYVAKEGKALIAGWMAGKLSALS